MGLSEVDYLLQAQDLLPPGPAWPRESDAFLTRLLSGLSIELARIDGRARQLFEEGDPRTTTELLADYERAAGLPDDCMAGAVLSVQDRRRLLWQKVTARGGQSAAYFIALAQTLGVTVTVDDSFRQLSCNGTCNGTLYSQGDEFYWRVNVPQPVANPRVMTCNDDCNDALQLYTPNLIECPIRERKPANTEVLFSYLP